MTFTIDSDRSTSKKHIPNPVGPHYRRSTGTSLNQITESNQKNYNDSLKFGNDSAFLENSHVHSQSNQNFGELVADNGIDNTNNNQDENKIASKKSRKKVRNEKSNVFSGSSGDINNFEDANQGNSDVEEAPTIINEQNNHSATQNAATSATTSKLSSVASTTSTLPSNIPNPPPIRQYRQNYHPYSLSVRGYRQNTSKHLHMISSSENSDSDTDSRRTSSSNLASYFNSMNAHKLRKSTSKSKLSNKDSKGSDTLDEKLTNQILSERLKSDCNVSDNNNYNDQILLHSSVVNQIDEEEFGNIDVTMVNSIENLSKEMNTSQRNSALRNLDDIHEDVVAAGNRNNNNVSAQVISRSRSNSKNRSAVNKKLSTSSSSNSSTLDDSQNNQDNGRDIASNSSAVNGGHSISEQHLAHHLRENIKNYQNYKAAQAAAIAQNPSGRVPISIVNNQIKKLPTSNRSYSTSDLNKKVNQLNLHKIAKDNARARSIASSFYRPSTKNKSENKENQQNSFLSIRSPSISINDRILYENKPEQGDMGDGCGNTSSASGRKNGQILNDERERPIRSVSLSLINRSSDKNINSQSQSIQSNIISNSQNINNSNYSGIDNHHFGRHSSAVNSDNLHEITFGNLARKHKSSSEHYDVRMNNFRLRGPSSIHQSLQSLPENVNWWGFWR